MVTLPTVTPGIVTPAVSDQKGRSTCGIQATESVNTWVFNNTIRVNSKRNTIQMNFNIWRSMICGYTNILYSFCDMCDILCLHHNRQNFSPYMWRNIDVQVFKEGLAFCRTSLTKTSWFLFWSSQIEVPRNVRNSKSEKMTRSGENVLNVRRNASPK